MLNIIAKRNVFFVISGLIVLAGIIGLIARGGFVKDIDFAGGTTIHYNLNKEFNNTELEEFVKSTAGVNLATVQKTGEAQKEAIIKTQYLNEEQMVKMSNAMKEKYGTEVQKLSSDNIDPTVGKELQTKALQAAGVASILMLIYITIRFQFKSGVAAVVALLHDVMMMFVVYAVFGFAISTSFVVAVLTVYGYSINDTIVVFDRIRENMRFAKKEDFASVVNRSIWDTMARSINTVLTTILTLVALYVMGVPSIKEFTLPLLVGILSGMYSSIFIASPVWVVLKNMEDKKKLKARTA